MLEFNYTILIQFANFLILLILLQFFLFRPVLNVLKKRKNAIDALGLRVEQLRGDATTLGRTYDESAKEKKRPILDQRESALKEAHAGSMKIIEEARHHLSAELEKIKEAVRNEADEALRSLTQKTSLLAAEVVAKVMKRGA
jgi:F-type H+-transporting ATPase subunit b